MKYCDISGTLHDSHVCSSPDSHKLHILILCERMDTYLEEHMNACSCTLSLLLLMLVLSSPLAILCGPPPQYLHSVGNWEAVERETPVKLREDATTEMLSNNNKNIIIVLRLSKSLKVRNATFAPCHLVHFVRMTPSLSLSSGSRLKEHV